MTEKPHSEANSLCLDRKATMAWSRAWGYHCSVEVVLFTESNPKLSDEKQLQEPGGSLGSLFDSVLTANLSAGDYKGTRLF